MACKPFKIAAAYDTETCNICTDEVANTWRAYPVLYIVNDLRKVELKEYEAGRGRVEFYRDGTDMLACVERYIEWGRDEGCVPIICAYNLMFDLQPIIYELNLRYDMQVSAQSSTSAYTVDLVDTDGRPLLRFWDMFYLEMRGLAKMGDTCGLPKATGDWDYSLIRTPDTPLTDEELYYAARDTEVLPAYLRYLLESNEWLEPEWLGVRVLTKTSLVRQAGKNETGRLRIVRDKGGDISVQASFERLCASELAPTYAQYALRKACFRGGFTFTAARYAGLVQRNVYSIDETSAHHAYINGHMLPVEFHALPPVTLQAMAENVASVALDAAIRHWEEPFGAAFHARIRFTNLRQRAGSAFDTWDIALIPEGKFKEKGQLGEWGGDADRDAVTAVRSKGYVDVAEGAVFAFGKLVAARSAILHVSEMELWCMAQVYEWDGMEAILGEGTTRFVKPPDYVTLLSNLFYARKAACKQILKTYETGVPYEPDIPASIPGGIADRLRKGSMTREDIESYYNSTVKGMFNSIYGMEAQDVFKAGYEVDEGVISVDRSTVTTRENYKEKYDEVKNKLVCYPYGLRIVGGSRMALVAAIALMYRAFGERVRVLGGDTDSLKISCDADVKPSDLMDALADFHVGVTASINRCMVRVRERYPDYASDLKDVGTFEVEGDAYPLHMDAWNKARVSWDGKRAHVTCAGLSRPQGMYNIEDWIAEMSAAHGFDEVAPRVLGYGVRVANGVCHALEHYRPNPSDVLDMDVTDYMGETRHVHSHESIALYPSDRVLGDTSKGGNARTADYLKKRWGRDIDTTERVIDVGTYTYIDNEGDEREW